MRVDAASASGRSPAEAAVARSRAATVLLVGCGELGSRHLQAVASLPEVARIDVVDARPEALAQGQRRLTEAIGAAAAPTVRWLSRLDEAAADGDLCIVATQAAGRTALVQAIARRRGYRAFLIEKIVAQSLAEYETLLAFASRHELAIWVNCKQRAEPITKYLLERIDPVERLIVSDVGGRHGLATNGIHYADLFLCLDRSDELRGAGASIDPLLHPSKRGPEVFDLSGTLLAVSPKGSQLLISYAPDHAGPDQISVVTPRARWVIDRFQRQAWESREDAGWAWAPIPVGGRTMVSEMTRAFAAALLQTGRCDLPTLAQCWPAHRYLLAELLPHFNRLRRIESDRCPVT